MANLFYINICILWDFRTETQKLEGKEIQDATNTKKKKKSEVSYSKEDEEKRSIELNLV